MNAIGPGIGTAAAPAPLTSLPPAPASLPAPPQTTSSYPMATVSSGPQPASAYQQPPVMLPPLHYQPTDAAQPFGYQPPAPNMRTAALAAANGALQGTVRTADEMEGAADEIPPAKRQKVNKVPGSILVSEEEWITMHPVSY